ncbi:MAG: hypothetical protein LUE93_06135 [Bacteroides sp.]|nr:hypothetical protein [Bacteroides sp.]
MKDQHLIRSIHTTYDEQGRETSTIIRNDKVAHQEKIAYDAHGEIISVEIDGAIHYQSTIDYKNNIIVKRVGEDKIWKFDQLDKYNNWTLCRIYDKYNRLTGIKKRSITTIHKKFDIHPSTRGTCVSG